MDITQFQTISQHITHFHTYILLKQLCSLISISNRKQKQNKKTISFFKYYLIQLLHSQLFKAQYVSIKQSLNLFLFFFCFLKIFLVFCFPGILFWFFWLTMLEFVRIGFRFRRNGVDRVVLGIVAGGDGEEVNSTTAKVFADRSLIQSSLFNFFACNVKRFVNCVVMWRLHCRSIVF